METNRFYQRSANYMKALLNVCILCLLCLFSINALAKDAQLYIRGDNYAILPLETGKYPFQNRTNMQLRDIPSNYVGWKFTQINANSSYLPGPLPVLEVKALESGTLTVMVSNLEKPDVCAEWAATNGWTLKPSDVLVYGSTEAQKFVFYEKQIEQGEWIQLVQPAVFSGALVLAPAIVEYSSLEALMEEVSQIDYSLITNGIRKPLEEAYYYALEFRDSEDEAELVQTADSLQKALNEYRLGEAKCMLLQRSLLDGYELIERTPFYTGTDEFLDSLEAVAALFEFDARTPDGSLVGLKEVEQALKSLESAIRKYRFTEPADSQNPADYTWYVANPSFHTGDTHDTNKGIFDGWKYDNVYAGGKDFAVRFKGERNCWNSWADNFTSMNLYQDLIGLKPGLYSMSCYGMTQSERITDQHAYATSSAGTVVSPVMTVDGGFDTAQGWEKLETPKILVAADGVLRIGFASTSPGTGTYGWFCATDFELKYYGEDEGGYAEALQKKIAEAEGMKDSVMLKGDLNNLDVVIEQAKLAQDPASINVALSDLNAAMNKVILSYKGLKEYEETVWNTVGNLLETLKKESSEELIYQILSQQDKLIQADTTTYLSIGVLNTILKSFCVYVAKYEEALLCMEMTSIYEQQNINELNGVVMAQTEVLITGGLTKEAITALESDLNVAIRTLRLTQKAGVDTDFSFVIVNPDINASGNSAPNGWIIDRINGNNYTSAGVHYNGDPNDHYLDCWGATGAIRYTAKQMITDIPNGTYKLRAVVRSSGEGAFLFATLGRDTLKVEFPVTSELGGSVWENAPEGSVERDVNGGKGYGWSVLELNAIEVSNHMLQIGVSTDSLLMHKPFTGSWFSADKFELFYLRAGDDTSVEEVSSDKSPASLSAYVHNGTLIVESEEEYTVTTLEGVVVSTNGMLLPGVYIVRSALKEIKIIVN